MHESSPANAPAVAWRRPRKAGTTTPLVVFLHGRGADEYDLLELADRLPRTYAYASIRAPYPTEGGGYTWFESRAVARPVAATLRASLTAFRSWLDDTALVPASERCFLLGFSAGMMMAAALILDDPARFAGAVLLSGAVPFDAGVTTAPDRLRGMPIFSGHGSLDQVIPPALVQQSRQYLLERSGAAVDVHDYGHAHTISPSEIDDIAAWFAART